MSRMGKGTIDNYGHEKLRFKEEEMSRYDEDIDRNPYLSEHGKYVAQFARNHGITVEEAHQHPMVIAHKEAWDHLRECFKFENGNLRI